MRRSDRRKRAVTIVVVLAALAVVLPFCYVNTRPTEIMLTVSDAETGERLGDAVVEIQNSNGQVILDFVTKADGTAGVKRMPIDEVGYRIEVRRLDYVPAARRNVALMLHKTTDVWIPLRPRPGGRLFVGVDDAYVAVVDTASLLFASYKRGPEGLRSWPIRQLAVHPDQPWLYLSARYASYILEPSRLDAIAELGLPGSVDGLVMTRDGRYLLASLRRQGQQGVAVIDAGTGFEEEYLEAAALPLDSATLALPGVDRYVVGDLLMVDRPSGRMAYSLPDLHRVMGIPFAPRWNVLSSDQSRLYLGGPDSPTALALDVATWAIVHSLPVGNDISGAAIHPDGSELYLANERLGLLMVLAVETGETLAQLPVGRLPIQVAVDSLGQRVYVANVGSQSVSVMDVATRRIIRTIDLGMRPHSMAVR